MNEYDPISDEDTDPATNDVTVPDGTSAFDALRRKRNRIAHEVREDDFDIPGYGGDLFGRFRVLDFDTLKKIATHEEKSRHPRKSQNAMADTLAWSCVGLSMRVNGDAIALEDVLKDGGGPVRFDRRLTIPLGLEAEPSTARAAVFAAIPDDLSLAAFHQDVALWMQDPDSGTDDDILGE